MAHHVPVSATELDPLLVLPSVPNYEIRKKAMQGSPLYPHVDEVMSLKVVVDHVKRCC